MLASRGIAHHLYDWSPKGGYEWPYWHHQMWEYVGALFWKTTRLLLCREAMPGFKHTELKCEMFRRDGVSIPDALYNLSL